MKKYLIPAIMIALIPACTVEDGTAEKAEKVDTAAVAAAGRMGTALNDHHTKPNSYETTSVTTFPDEALDHPFTYIMNRVIGREDQRMMLYTVIPHAADATYRLVNEKLDGTTWDLFFQNTESQGVAKGLFVHTIYQIPNTVDGRVITDIKVHIMDAAGNVQDDEVGPRKPKRPRHVRVGDKPDVDPNMPPEDPTIYVNGGMDSGSQYVCGFAYVYQLADGLTLTDDIPGNTVTFGLSSTAGTTDFIWFDHNVDAFGTNAVKCTFTDNDGDTNTDPRWTVCAP